jgi:hypothetical protein
MAAKPRIAPKNVTVTARWATASELPVEFADQMHVQRTGDRFFVTLGQGAFPLMEGPPQGDIEISIRPLHRYVISTADLRRFVEALQQTLPAEDEQ